MRITLITPAVTLALVAIGLFALGGCSPPNVASTGAPILPGRAPSSTEARPDGATRLTTPPDSTSDQNPAFSPDGQTILFTRFHKGYNDGPAGLCLLPFAGGAPVTLLYEEGQDSVNLPGSSWNGVTHRITFASDREDTDEVWTMADDGTDLFRVTHHTPVLSQVEETAGYFIEPSFSPDGQWIVFEAETEANTDAPKDQQQGSIWKVHADGTGLTQLTDGPGSGADDRQPNWSPSGDIILFQRRAPGSEDWNLYTMAPDGSDVRPVTTAPSSDTDASWSPNGRCIVYSSDYGALPVPNIFVISALGGAPIHVTRDDTHEDGAPSWSPDGKWIAFESHEGQDEDSPSALWRIAVPAGVCDEEFHVYLPITLTSTASSKLLAINDFLYQLQNLDLIAVGNTAYDLVVMDYSAEGDDDTAFTAAQIAALQHSPGGEKVVLAYMSIGEAEDYRFYWQDGWEPGHPAWLDAENPDWAGNYKVHYWDPAWQAIIFDYTDRLLDAGFDGAYLDIIDAYEYYADGSAGLTTSEGRDSAAQEMADFVAAIATRARARDPDFLVFPQNAPELASLAPAFLNSVDGIGQEDVYYGYDGNDVMTPAEITASLEGDLDVFKNAGKLVLTVDYATTPAHVDDAYAKSRAKGYVPFVTIRDLDQLTINPDHEPD